MRTISNITPEALMIDRYDDGTCDVVFTTNIVQEEVTADDNTTFIQYKYDLYRKHTEYSDTLYQRVDSNYEDWLSEAISEELKDVSKKKINEMSATCQKLIQDGVSVTTSYGVEHFSLESHDQQNLSTIAMMIQTGIAGYPYHADGKPCVVYSAEDLGLIVAAATNHIKYHTTYFNLLHVWIKRETDYDTIYGIYYGIELPNDLAQTLSSLVD